eukprot:gnl/MRDRNA2_/MRDRNA2_73230_c0_seq1.p1 gnl/MRDRNA2_/MRDRNA2_73230_c0~~gnl/MRDRNA2_/MRDRNA2_73230_c0_seq1.p1  ORF type:complete len:1187 (-),score=166.78 gnl/MRDRNA2_/MRDRNA2_73230_c0_seq1:17-3577(-)
MRFANFFVWTLLACIVVSTHGHRPVVSQCRGAAKNDPNNHAACVGMKDKALPAISHQTVPEGALGTDLTTPDPPRIATLDELERIVGTPTIKPGGLTEEDTTLPPTFKQRAMADFSEASHAIEPDQAVRNHPHCKQLNETGTDDELALCSCDAKHPVRVNYTQTCPTMCPMSQNWTAEPCTKMCVFADACPDFHMARTFASPQLMECVGPCGKKLIDKIPGCLKCRKVGVCEKCYTGFKLENGGSICVNDRSVYYTVLYVMIGVFGIPAFIALTCLALARPKVHPEIFFLGHRHKARCYPSRISPEHGGCWAPLSTYHNFLRLPSEGSQDIMGIGTILMYRYYCFLMVCLVCMSASLYVTYHFSAYAHNQELAMEEAANETVTCATIEAATANASASINLIAPAASMVRNAPFVSSLLQNGGVTSALAYARSQFPQPQPSNHQQQLPLVSGGSSFLELGEKQQPAPQTNWAKKAQVEAEREKEKEKTEAPVHILRYNMFVSMVSTWAILMVLTFAFGRHILNVAKVYDDKVSTQKDFCLQINGLPASATDPQEITDHFGNWLGSSAPTVGCSIAYDYVGAGEEDTIDEGVDLWAEELDKEKPLKWLDDEDVKDHSFGALQGVFNNPIVARLADKYWGAGHEEHEGYDKELETRLAEVLPSLNCSGTAYLIFHTQKGVGLALEKAKSCPAFKNSQLTLKPVYSEPADIAWVHHKRSWGWLWKVPLSFFFCVLSAILFFALCIPILMVFMHANHIPGEDPDFIAENVLGLLPAAGGAIVCIVVDMCVEWCGYKEMHQREIYLLPGCFILNYVTVLGDIIMVMAFAEGDMVDGAGALNFDRVLARELYEQLVPAYIIFQSIVPAMAETIILPYLLGDMLVRMSPMTRRQAEKGLEPFPFDFAAHYVDCLIGVAALFTMLCFLSPSEWKSIVAAVLCVFAMYLTCQWTMIRGYGLSLCTSEHLCWDGLHLWCFPMALLFTCGLWWGSFGGHVPTELVGWGWLINTIIFVVGLRLVKKSIPARVDRDDTYQEVCGRFAMFGKHATYFNTNPVFLLRARYLNENHGGMGSTIIPWLLGKEHYHPGAPTVCLPRPTWWQAICCCPPALSQGGGGGESASAQGSARETTRLRENRAPAPRAAASSTATGARQPQIRQRTAAASAASAAAAPTAPSTSRSTADPEATGGDEELKF